MATIFNILCLIILGISLYLTLAKCYNTGFCATVGYMCMSGAMVIYLGEPPSPVPSRAILLLLGVTLVLLQLAGRAVYHAIKEREKNGSGESRTASSN